jgi:phytoene synthase
MRLDVQPKCFSTLDDLIDEYVYGSAVVVGYFLAYVYGPSHPSLFGRTLSGAKNLGIALQLTNFLRDVAEDRRRGRLYLPTEFLRAEGLDEQDGCDTAQSDALSRVVRRMAMNAEAYYSLAERDLEAFAEDSQVAIRACVDVYRRLNQRIANSADSSRRVTVPMTEKFEVLPPSKYWRLPLAWAGIL